jgi:hypothetical protein
MTSLSFCALLESADPDKLLRPTRAASQIVASACMAARWPSLAATPHICRPAISEWPKKTRP